MLSSVTSRPSSVLNEHTPRSVKPHGLISSNQRRSVETFIARPCIVTPCDARTPIAQSFSKRPLRETHTPEAPALRSASIPYYHIAYITSLSSLISLLIIRHIFNNLTSTANITLLLSVVKSFSLNFLTRKVGAQGAERAEKAERGKRGRGTARQRITFYDLL